MSRWFQAPRPVLRLSAAATLALAAAGAGVLGCPGTLEGKECFLQEERAFALLSETCTGTGCHNAEEKVFGLDLQTPGIGPRLKGQAALDCAGNVIEPGKPEESVLYTKLFDPPPCGSRMPLGKPELYEEELEVLRVWIKGMDGSCAGGTGTGGNGSGGNGSGGTSAGGGTATTSSTSSTSATTTSQGGAGGAGGG